MAAFNWIVFENICPNCGKTTLIKAQCHVASTFDGDVRGRFCNNTYKLNENMIWWAQDDIRWSQWRDGGLQGDDNADLIYECCYANCEECSADIFAVIAFEPVKPVNVRQIGFEKDWPPAYKK